MFHRERKRERETRRQRQTLKQIQEYTCLPSLAAAAAQSLPASAQQQQVPAVVHSNEESVEVNGREKHKKQQEERAR